MKLSAKFARQESEEARLARIGRRRISEERADAVRQFLGIPAPAEENGTARAADLTHTCDLCGRQHVALRNLISRNRRSGRALDFYFPRRNCNAHTLRFCRNIHHLHLSIGTDVTKPLQSCSTPLFQAFHRRMLLIRR